MGEKQGLASQLAGLRQDGQEKNVQKRSKTFENIRKRSKIFKNIQILSRNVQKYSKIFNELMVTGEWEIRRLKTPDTRHKEKFSHRERRAGATVLSF